MMDRPLHQLNRAIVVFVALVALAGAVITLLVGADALAPDFLPGGSGDPSTGSWFQPQLESVDGFGGGSLAISVLVSVLVALVTLVLISVEFRSREHGRSLMISANQEGGLTIEEDSVRYLAERTGSSNRQVVSLSCRLQVRGKRSAIPASIVISCYPRVAFGTDVREIRDDLQGRVKDTVEKLTGLTVLRVNVAKVKFERGNTTRLLDG